jgi:hypothetical protein
MSGKYHSDSARIKTWNRESILFLVQEKKRRDARDNFLLFKDRTERGLVAFIIQTIIFFLEA